MQPTKVIVINSAFPKQSTNNVVRTPLNAIINYLELALENKLDESTLDTLEKAHKASRSLVYVIDDLLNLTKAEEGKIEAPQEVFDLGATGQFTMTMI